jgi:hypothetical protein
MACQYNGTNIVPTCEDIKKAIGGLAVRVWALPVIKCSFDWESVRDAVTREVEALPLVDPLAADQLIAIESVKNGIEALYTNDVVEATSTVTYPQQVTIKMITESALLRELTEKLNRISFVLVVERLNRTFEVFGASNGLSITASDGKNIGFRATGQDVSDTAIYSSPSEQSKPFVFSVGTYATTKAYLEGLTIA